MSKVSSLLSRYPKWLWHVVLWTIAFVYLEMIPISAMLSDNDGVPASFKYVNLLNPILTCLLFYFNYNFLVQRMLGKKRYLSFIFINIAAISLSIGILYICNLLIFKQIGVPNTDPPIDNIEIFFSGIFSAGTCGSKLLVVFLAAMIKTTSLWNEERRRNEELERVKIEAELKNLKSQINPHFLFNTLNNIYTLATIDAERTQEAIHSLSDLLRYVLNDQENDMVPLEKEIKFTRGYIDLMSLRLDPARTSLEVSLPDNCGNAMVAPLLLVTLIENAFKHGVSTTGNSFIKIDIRIEGNWLYAYILNSSFPKDASDRSGSGIGLENLKRRLDLIYRKDYSMKVKKGSDTYSTELSLKLSYGKDQNNCG